MMFIKLTGWQSNRVPGQTCHGAAVYVNIMLVQTMRSFVGYYVETKEELGLPPTERKSDSYTLLTLVSPMGDYNLLVQETPEQIIKMIEEKTQ